MHVPGTLMHGNISDTLTLEIRNLIVDGTLPAGSRINEVHLSQQLGVSRTPLREALLRLAHEGALDPVPRIGYFVRPLTLCEFEQIYPIRALLDPEALRLAGLPDRERLDHLEQINAGIASAEDADQIIDLDDEFHLYLIAPCPNEVLFDLIRQFMQRTRRYELALMRERQNVAVASATHQTILRRLRRRNLDGACTLLRRNMVDGYQPILAWLREREQEA